MLHVCACVGGSSYIKVCLSTIHSHTDRHMNSENYLSDVVDFRDFGAHVIATNYFSSCHNSAHKGVDYDILYTIVC